MESFAEMTCVLKVKIHCEICKGKVMQVLQNLHGLYSFVIDAEKGTVEVSGKVDPEMILRVLGKYDKHAEISCLRFDGDHVQENHCYSYRENWYMPPGVAYPYPMLGPDYQYYETCPQFVLPPPPPPPPPPLPPLLPPLRPRQLLTPVNNSSSMQQVVPSAPPSEEPESCSIM